MDRRVDDKFDNLAENVEYRYRVTNLKCDTDPALYSTNKTGSCHCLHSESFMFTSFILSL